MKTKFLYRCPKCGLLMEFDTEQKITNCDGKKVKPQRLYMGRFYWVKTKRSMFWQPAFLGLDNEFAMIDERGKVTHVGKQIKEPKE